MGGGTLEAEFNRIHSQSQGSTECGSGYPVMSARVGRLALFGHIPEAHHTPEAQQLSDPHHSKVLHEKQYQDPDTDKLP